MRKKNKATLLYIFIIFCIANCSNSEKETPTTLEAIKQISVLEDSIFFKVVTEMKYENNSVYILDNTPQILQINPDFKVVNRIHDIGKGPGQFTGILDFSFVHDSLYVYDRELAKVLVYDQNSVFARDFILGDNATGNDITIANTNAIFLNSPFSKSPIIEFDLNGSYIKTLGENTADYESYNALRNWRLLLAHEQRIIAISKSDPFIKIYKSNGDLLSETEIRHPILDDRISQIKESYKSPSAQGGYSLSVLINDADLFNDKLYLLAVTNTDENSEPKYTFVLAYDINKNGDLVNKKTYKLYQKEREKELDGLSLVVLRDNKMLIYDRNTGSLWLFKDETI